MPRTAGQDGSRVLVIKLGALGDLVQAFDAFHDIRRFHRRDRVVLLTTAPFTAFAQRMPWFDEVWPDGRSRAGFGAGATLRLIRRLRRSRFARVYDLQCNDRTALYFHLLFGRHRPDWVGTVTGATFRPAPPRPGERHNADRMRAELASAGVPEARPTGLAWLDADVAPLALPDRFVLLVPGSSPSHPEKRWPAEHYAALGDRLRGERYEVVLAGTTADSEPIAEIKRRLPAAINLMGRTSLIELAAVARRAAGAVGNDTGPVFLAAALGTPTLMLMSRVTDPEQSAPRGAMASWLRRDDLAALPVEAVAAALRWRAENPDSAARFEA